MTTGTLPAATAAPPTRRRAELGLLLLAALIVVAAAAAVEAARNGHIGPGLITFAAVTLISGLAAHLVVRWVAPYADPVLLPCAIVLNGLGLVMIDRLDLGLAVQARDNGVPVPEAAAPTQVAWTGLGILLFIVILLIVRDHRVLARYAYTLALAGLFLLILPAVLPARFAEINGARIWILIAGFSIQPAEFAKILLTIFAAAYLVAKRDVLSLAGRRFLGIDLPRGRDFGPLLLAWLICIGVLIRGHDLGTSLLFFGVFVVLLYVATERISWVTVWLDVFHYTDGIGYQVSQSLFGLGTGGMFGTGLGVGHPEIVPLPATDFILTSFGEELGLFGLIALLLIYVLFVERGFAAGLAVRDSFGKLLATGLSFLIGLQLFVVAAGVSRLLPETGLTTPFLSYGGSSLLANYALLALLLRISDAARRPSPQRPAGSTPPPRPAEVVPA